MLPGTEVSQIRIIDSIDTHVIYVEQDVTGNSVASKCSQNSLMDADVPN